MPKLDDPIHLDMHRASRPRRSPIRRIVDRLLSGLFGTGSGSDLYGYEWGHPESCPPLAYVLEHFLKEYVRSNQTALEIGPGGGRWTQYMLDFGQLYVVDYHAELLDELRKNFDRSNMQFIHNGGTDFPGVSDASIDYLFSFGTFVHLDVDLIDQYLANMRRILKPGGNAVIQYADKTKIMAQQNPGFSENDPSRMRKMVAGHGYRILEEDLTTLWHSSMIRFGLAG